VPRVQVGGQAREPCPPAALAEPERAGDRREDEGGIDERGQGDEGDVAREVRAHVGSHAQGEAGLADAARPGQRHQPGVGAREQGDQGRHRPVPPDQRVALHRQWCAVRCHDHALQHLRASATSGRPRDNSPQYSTGVLAEKPVGGARLAPPR
jgi:hypothetical protein